MPTLHNPLGWLTSRQRQALTDLARLHDLWIIEDTAYAWLVEQSPPPLASYAPEERFISPVFEKRCHRATRGAVICPPYYRRSD